AEVRSSEFLASPNPTNGITRVLLPSAGVVDVTDLSGRLVMQERLQAGLQSIDLGALPAGVYVLNPRVEGVSPISVVRAD
ncbi:MAG: T9SS type A sorting domain-containing protein, partial [Flavobacteriales bacterium]|nr:T9SS type A sorting domain-containing protein [Flavobacteriales bacterium]